MCRTNSLSLPGHRIWGPDACFQTPAPPSARSLSLGSVVAPLCFSLRTCKLGATPFLFLMAAVSLGAAGPSVSARPTELVVTWVSGGRDVARTSLSPWGRPLGRVGFGEHKLFCSHALRALGTQFSQPRLPHTCTHLRSDWRRGGGTSCRHGHGLGAMGAGRGPPG